MSFLRRSAQGPAPAPNRSRSADALAKPRPERPVLHALARTTQYGGAFLAASGFVSLAVTGVQAGHDALTGNGLGDPSPACASPFSDGPNQGLGWETRDPSYDASCEPDYLGRAGDAAGDLYLGGLFFALGKWQRQGVGPKRPEEPGEPEPT